VNGLHVQVGPCSSSDLNGQTTWTVPALGVEIVATDRGTVTGAGPTTVVGRILHTLRRATPTEIATRSPLVLRIALERTRVHAGTSIPGTATFENTTSMDIVVGTCAKDGWLDVGLVGNGITFDPAHIQIACAASVHLAPGTSRFPVTVSTTYGGCSPPGTSNSMFPSCIPTGVPPLPPETYRTSIVTVGLPSDMSRPNVLAVTLLR
jgi:hypothetical protein